MRIKCISLTSGLFFLFQGLFAKGVPYYLGYVMYIGSFAAIPVLLLGVLPTETWAIRCANVTVLVPCAILLQLLLSLGDLKAMMPFEFGNGRLHSFASLGTCGTGAHGTLAQLLTKIHGLFCGRESLGQALGLGSNSSL